MERLWLEGIKNEERKREATTQNVKQNERKKKKGNVIVVKSDDTHSTYHILAVCFKNCRHWGAALSKF